MMFNKLLNLPSLPVITLLLTVFLSAQSTSAQSIASARAQAPGSTVTVRGIVTSGAELGKIRYLQDGTAGIAAFPGTGSVAGFDGTVFPGDSIEIKGVLVNFHNLLEISPITAFTVISNGNPLPEPKAITFSQISDEFESQLVQFDCIAFGNAGGAFNSSGAYGVADSEGKSSEVYLRSGHPMLGTDIPALPIRLIAILSAYDNDQLLPRSTQDFEPMSCFFFTQTLQQSNINTTGFKISWQTNVPSDGLLRFGTTPNPTQIISVPLYSTDHEYVFNNLMPGTIYWVQVESKHNGETLLSEPKPFATQSLSSGQIEVFFNQGMDAAYSNGYAATGETYEAVLNATIAHIDAAVQTLDVAVYNNNRADITDALKAAHARGVRVRYIASADPNNSALIPAPSFPVLYGNDVALMHHKFMIIDADLTDKAWVMSGSLNWTEYNMIKDYNNTLFIQDQSLARAYEIEFEEMYGSAGLLPDLLESRFGPGKRDNTPHQFVIGGNRVESYFSPSDGTSYQIENVLHSAQSEALFAAYSFTKNELGNALLDAHYANVPVRGIMENIGDPGAEYDYLLSKGLNIRHHFLSGEFHHKYGVVDAYDLNSDPTVVTGSHNWTITADASNDENTLILHDPKLAALFKAEFEKRWGEFPTSVKSAAQPSITAFPNPASEWLELRGLAAEAGTIQIKNMLGQLVYSSDQMLAPVVKLDLSGLKSGHYFVIYLSDHGLASIPFQKI